MIYCYMRYSSDGQTGGVSLDMQRQAIRNFINASIDLRGKEIAEFCDEAKTGTSLNGRNGLAQIRQQAQRGDYVLVYKLDRLGRNLHDSLQVLKDLEGRGVKMLSATEPEMPLARHILLAFAEEFSRQLSDRCKRALDGIASKGFVTNGSAYGYKIERVGDRGKYAVIPDEASVVKRIFALRAKGYSHREIVRTLNADKIPSPRGGMWSVGGIAAMLKNDVYRGTVISGVRKFQKGVGLIEKRPKGEWSVCRNAHEAIVAEDLWARVRSRDSASTNKHTKGTSSKARYLLSGFLKCSECGANLVVDQSSKTKIRYYGCQSGRDYGISKPCQCRSLIRMEIMNEAVIQVLIKNVLSERWIDEVVKVFKQEVGRARGTVKDFLPLLTKELEQKERKIESSTRAMVHVDEDLREVYLDEIRILKADRDQLKLQLERAHLDGGALTPVAVLEKKLRERIRSLETGIRGQDVQQARDLLAQYIDRIEVSPKKEALLFAKQSFPMLATESVNIPTGI